MVTFSVSIFRHSNALKLRTTEFPNPIGRSFLEQKEHTKLQTIPTKSRELHHIWSMSRCCTMSITQKMHDNGDVQDSILTVQENYGIISEQTIIKSR